MTNETYDLSLLDKSQQHWNQSSGLRMVYQSFYRKMRTFAKPGTSLEIGSGIGTLRTVIPDVVTTDISKTPFVEQAMSAYDIRGTWDTIYAMDVLHHLQTPLTFLTSAHNALTPGGRIVLLEPAATPFGTRFYRLFHHEPIVPSRLRYPYLFPADNDKGSFANMGMGVALFDRDRKALETELQRAGLRVITVSYHSWLSYPLTGGFSHRQYVPDLILRGLMTFEACLPSCVMRVLGLRMWIILERI